MARGQRARRRLLVWVAGERRWAAWLEDARLVEFHCQDGHDEEAVGSMFVGRVTRVDKGLAAAFVDIGRGRTAFLPFDDAPRPPIEGATVVVQVERPGRDDKAPRITARPSMIGPRLLFRPQRRGVSVSQRIADKGLRTRLADFVGTLLEAGEGALIRTAAASASDEQLREELSVLRARWDRLRETLKTLRPPVLLQAEPAVDLRLLRDHGSQFDEIIYDSRRAAQTASEWCSPLLPDLVPRITHQKCAAWFCSPADVLGQVQEALEPRVPLPAGGTIIIESTAAMTVIDVNAESAGGAQADVTGERVILRTNLAAAREIARQLRLRNIGGIVVVDFIDLKDAAARRQVVECLRTAAAEDPVDVWVGGMSRLGLVELTRKRRGPTLAESMTELCKVCDGTGRVVGDMKRWMPGDTS